jgi:hypothetical protein
MAKLPPYAVPLTKPTGPIERIVPSEEERRNGWDEQTLSEYVHQRREAEKARLNPHHPSRRQRPDRANGHRWRFPARRSWTVKPSWQR